MDQGTDKCSEQPFGLISILTCQTSVSHATQQQVHGAVAWSGSSRRACRCHPLVQQQI